MQSARLKVDSYSAGQEVQCFMEPAYTYTLLTKAHH
jgi:hypothetical protein